MAIIISLPFHSTPSDTVVMVSRQLLLNKNVPITRLVQMIWPTIYTKLNYGIF